MFQSDKNILGNTELILIYDGDCPFCRSYVGMLRLKDTIDNVILINARDGGAHVEEATRKGLDLNEGMALLYAGTWYHGPDCMHILSSMTTSSRLLNRVTARIFSSASRAKALYPILRFGRNITLKLLGTKHINL